MDKKTERHYWVFRCENTHPNQRPNGKKMREGCLTWGIKSTKHSDLNDKQLVLMGGCQGLCKKCGRKPRLQPRTTNLKGFKSKEAAVEYCDAMNSTGVGF